MIKRTIVRVGDVMSPKPQFIDGMATVSDAIEMMRKGHLSSLLIDRRDQDDEYGILVVTDIAREIIARHRAPDRTHVYEIMTKPVLGVDRRMDIKYAVRLLIHFELSRCLVVEGKEAIGIVTLRDMIVENPHAVQ